MNDKLYTCFRCKKNIGRTVESCTVCLKDFHPKCTNSSCHRIFDKKNNLVPCTGPYEIYRLQPTGKKEFRRRRTMSAEYNDDELDDVLNQNKDNVNCIDSTEMESDQLKTRNDQNVSQTQVLLNPSIDQIDNQILSISSKVWSANNINNENMGDYIKRCIKNEVAELKSLVKAVIVKEIVKVTDTFKEELVELKNLIITMSTNKNQNLHPNTIHNNTYSAVAKTNVNKNIERIVIKPLSDQNGIDTLNQIKKNIDVVNLGIGVSKIVSRPTGKVIIDLDREIDKVTLTKEIESKLGDTFEVITHTKKLPKLKIVGLHKELIEMDDKVLINNLCKQNNLNKEQSSEQDKCNSSKNNGCSENNGNNNSIRIIKRYLTKNDYGTVLLEVNPSIHRQILNNNRIKIGWRNYKVFNYINIIRCFNCWGYNHFKNKCTKKKVCRICADNHDEKNCHNNLKKCVNCMEMKKKSKIEWSIDH